VLNSRPSLELRRRIEAIIAPVERDLVYAQLYELMSMLPKKDRDDIIAEFEDADSEGQYPDWIRNGVLRIKDLLKDKTD
jgi:hypothetical protein